MDAKTPTAEKLSFEEFKLYYESAEKVTERRLSANTWNHSLCVAIVVAIAVTINWTVSHRPFFYVGLVGVIVICAMATLFCSLWMGQVDDFKLLNNAKFKVLNQMAPNIEFDPTRPGQAKSFCPFEKEWQVLQEVKAAVAISQHKIVALKSSNIEYFIPKAFRVVFLTIIVASVLAIGFNWPAFVGSWKELIHAGYASVTQ
jgi:hypothetical protein